MVPVAGIFRVLPFLSAIHFSTADFVAELCCGAPLWTAARHLVLSEVACFCDDGFMLNAFSDSLVVSLKTIHSVVFLFVQMIGMPILKTLSKKYASPMH